MSVTTLDIQSIIPQNRHPLVFAVFESTVAGEAFVLVNNHDPKPLYHQLSHQYPGEFSWIYLEDGPKTWRVEVRKAANNAETGGGCCGHCGC